MTKEGQKLGGIEFFRFYFMVWICLFHIWTPFKTPHANFAVEFFFIIAGVFVYKSFLKGQTSPWKFAIKRFKRLFPAYFVGITLAYAVFIVDSLKDSASINWPDLMMNYLPDSLMIQEIGAFYFPPVHAATWFVGVLFIGSLLIYAALAFNQKLALHILFPIAILGTYSLVFSNNLHLVDLFATESPLKGAVFLPLARGVAAMCLGVLLVSFNDICLPAGKHLLLDALSIICVILLTIYGFFIQPFYESQMLILFCILAISLLNPQSLFNKLFKGKIWKFLGGITYEMLLLHIPCRFLINYAYSLFPYYRNLWIIIYLMLTILTAYFLKVGIRKIVIFKQL